jgi:hypothetical protein
MQSLETDGYIARKQERRLDKAIKYVLVSGKKALADAGLDWQGDDIKQLDKARCGILIGSAFGGMQTFATAVEALETQGEYSMGGQWQGRGILLHLGLSCTYCTQSQLAKCRTTLTAAGESWGLIWEAVMHRVSAAAQ